MPRRPTQTKPKVTTTPSYGGTEPQELEQTYPLSQISSPREEGQDEQCVVKRFKAVNEQAGEELSEQDKLRKLVKCLASIIVNDNTFSPSQHAPGLSSLFIIWTELSFMPSIDIDLDDLESVTATYIF
ncbi:long-chain fatty acid--CoA ligase [Sesbania bispinosa]|nr:long-chain fatty acid--CoA ligase [Sesbania bispinosa]